MVCSQTRTVPRFESELRSINIEDDMNEHLHNTYIVANLLLYVLKYEQVYKDETKIIRLNEKSFNLLSCQSIFNLTNGLTHF